jgi:hypothetical protein
VWKLGLGMLCLALIVGLLVLAYWALLGLPFISR